MENIKLIETLEGNLLNEELYESLVNGLIDGEFTIDELRDLVKENEVGIIGLVEEIILEYEYISDMKNSIKDDFEMLSEENVGSSHYHNDEGGNN